jgi:hypothetical protein
MIRGNRFRASDGSALLLERLLTHVDVYSAIGGCGDVDCPTCPAEPSSRVCDCVGFCTCYPR